MNNSNKLTFSKLTVKGEKTMNKAEWIYNCRTVKEPGLIVCESADVKTEAEAIEWCEKKAKQYPGVAFMYSKKCQVFKELRK